MPKLKASRRSGKGDEEETRGHIPGKPTRSGSIGMGLVNILARAIPILRAEDQLSNPANEVQYTISYGLFCEEGDKFSRARWPTVTN
jgi:hypothetical protein